MVQGVVIPVPLSVDKECTHHTPCDAWEVSCAIELVGFQFIDFQFIGRQSGNGVCFASQMILGQHHTECDEYVLG